jgi:hypothetical protein
MPKSQNNINLEVAMDTMKKDVIKNGGSCFFVVINDGEMIQFGGGDSELIKYMLRVALGQIDGDTKVQNGIVKPF